MVTQSTATTNRMALYGEVIVARNSIDRLLAAYAELKQEIVTSELRPFVGLYDLDQQTDWLKAARYYIANLEAKLKGNDTG